jgi:hypothetical protein
LEKIMTTPTIKTVTADEEEAAINVVVQAFSTDPAARWLYPDPHQYAVNFPSFVRIFGGKVNKAAPILLAASQARRSGCRRVFTLMKRHWPD